MGTGMEPADRKVARKARENMNVAILDLISSKPERNLYGRLLNAVGVFPSLEDQDLLESEELLAQRGW